MILLRMLWSDLFPDRSPGVRLAWTRLSDRLRATVAAQIAPSDAYIVPAWAYNDLGRYPSVSTKEEG